MANLTTKMFELLLLIFALVTSTLQMDPVLDQLPLFKNKTAGPIGTLTTSTGAPVDIQDTGSTLNTNLNTNAFFSDAMSHFVREKTVERIVHAKGAGAFGYFVSTQNISRYCKASFLELGTQTPVVARFSVAQGSPETSRTLVGFAVKFYTTEGNLDIVGLNSPTFVLKDPALFIPFIHAFKRNPANNLKDVNMVWDYISLHPESIYTFLRVFGDRGLTNCYRHMPGYSIQTYVFYNAAGVRSYGRIYFDPVAGEQYLDSATAATTAASDPDFCTRDLYKSIGNSNYPAWNVSIQILSEDDVKNAPSDVFDTTKKLSKTKYPPQQIGQLFLNRNPLNYYADIEQLAFNPGNLVPGMLGCPDKVFETRMMYYREAQSHRLGPNYNNIQVNLPYRSKALTYNRDGLPPVNFNGLDSPNYYPNSFNGSVPSIDKTRPALPQIHENEPNNLADAKDYYTNEMSSDEQGRFVQTVVKSLCFAASYIQKQTVDTFGKIDANLSAAVADALRVNNCTH